MSGEVLMCEAIKAADHGERRCGDWRGLTDVMVVSGTSTEEERRDESEAGEEDVDD